MNDILNYVYLNLKSRIINGDLPASAKLPSSRKLSKTYPASRTTILSAMNLLERDGLIEKFKRGGIYVKGIKEKSENLSFNEKKLWLRELSEKLQEIF
jgi:DNA-binding GntR family transcriptional regulator